MIVAVVVVAVIAAGGLGAISLTRHFIQSVTVTETETLNFVYYLSPSVVCGDSGSGLCFGGNFSEAIVFNCASAAASRTGCSRQVGSSYQIAIGYGYQITIWYPYAPHSGEPSWANCMYEYSGDAGQHHYGYCISTNSTAFIVTEPAPPPT